MSPKKDMAKRSKRKAESPKKKRKNKQMKLNFSGSAKNEEEDGGSSQLVDGSDESSSESMDDLSDGESEADDSGDSDFELYKKRSDENGVYSDDPDTDDLESMVEETSSEEEESDVSIGEDEEEEISVMSDGETESEVESSSLGENDSENSKHNGAKDDAILIDVDESEVTAAGEEKKSDPSRKRKRAPKANAKKKAKKQKKGGKDEKKKKDEKKVGGRRNIAKIMDDSKLAKTTKEAEKAEKDRLERIRKRQERIVGSTEENKDDCICINPYRNEDERPFYVNKQISKHLKPHQIEGLRFIWDNCVESGERLAEFPDSGTGCIIAHLMGLGKTLLCISFIEAVLANGLGKNFLALVPVNVIHNWDAETKKWLNKRNRPRLFILDGSRKKSLERLKVLKSWRKNGGVALMGYEMFRNLVNGKRGKPKIQEQFQELLLDIPDFLIVDEGHRIKNEKSSLSQALSRVKTPRRVVLTGTPLQNNLLEYFFMVDFVRPHYLGTIKEFRNRFEIPINNGQCRDSTAADVNLMKERTFVLHSRLKGFVHRQDYSDMGHRMPVKHDYAVFVQLSKVQKQLYTQFLKDHKTHGGGLFSAYHQLMKVWNHPDALVKFRDQLEKKSKQQDIKNFLVNDNDDENGANGKSSSSSKSNGVVPADMHIHIHNGNKRYITRKWWGNMLEEESGYIEDTIEYSGKAMLTLRIVEKSLEVGDKVVIFSQSLFVLDFLQDVLDEHLDLKRDRDVFRIDGSVPAALRQKFLKKFNSKPKPQDPSSKKKVRVPSIFLVSTKAGCLGVNLHSANRVIVFDVSWNPSHDIQAICRSYRFGQEKQVYVYRLVASGTMEQKIYERQMIKQGLALRVVDEYQVDRVFDKSEIEKLFQYEDEKTDDMIALDSGKNKPKKDVEWLPAAERKKKKEQEKKDERDGKKDPNVGDSLMVTLLSEFGSTKLQKMSERLFEKLENSARSNQSSSSQQNNSETNEPGQSSSSTKCAQIVGNTSVLAKTLESLEPHAWIKHFDQPQYFLENVENEKLTKQQEEEALKNYERAIEQEKMASQSSYGGYHVGGYGTAGTSFYNNRYGRYGSLDNILLINRHALGIQRSCGEHTTQLICPNCTAATKISTPMGDKIQDTHAFCNVCTSNFSVGPPIYDEHHPDPSLTNKIPGNIYVNCPRCRIRNTFPKPRNMKTATIACGGCKKHFRVDILNNRVIQDDHRHQKHPKHQFVGPPTKPRPFRNTKDTAIDLDSPPSKLQRQHQTQQKPLPPSNGPPSSKSSSSSNAVKVPPPPSSNMEILEVFDLEDDQKSKQKNLKKQNAKNQKNGDSDWKELVMDLT